ncbi:MAG: N-acetylmuramoyl-L-alanine amidase [Ruminococcaceae bacterium]|nr:N-acetylmuramoyl-L-alanine amidase [Oscillospiraceae bacterium]
MSNQPFYDYERGGYAQNAPQSPGPARRPVARTAPQRKKRFWPVVVLALLLFTAAVAVILMMLGAFSGSGTQPNANVAEAPRQQAGLPAGGPPYVVALDAGHGGNDVGAEGVIQEIEMTEKTVACLYQLLEDDANFTPVLCREAGQGATIDERVARAKDAGAALLLSVHGNSDPTYASTTGFECFPQPPGRTHHDAGLTFANYIAEEMRAAGAGTRGDYGVRYLYFIDQGNGNYERMYREVSDTSTYSDATLGILERASCPAVLAEQCYITNEADVRAFASDTGCQTAADSYYSAICRYFGV